MSLSSVFAVTIMMGMEQVVLSFFRMRQMSRPLMSGSIRSSTSKSGCSLRARSSASFPSFAVRDVYAFFSTLYLISSRIGSSSSTIKIFIFPSCSVGLSVRDCCNNQLFRKCELFSYCKAAVSHLFNLAHQVYVQKFSFYICTSFKPGTCKVFQILTLGVYLLFNFVSKIKLVLLEYGVNILV